ncbi:aminoglycoside phosphotransferase family protein [Qipengyuania sediminis]|uniref:aminoglycoside phosphotransferase family protein n=1 Tax=Qipengyuania sediminis TaxID=1532023 RepID=UPI00105A9C2B|nr:phosphotransferase [Qipengyuania sediminis]
MSDLPQDLDSFLAAAGWGDAEIAPLPGDASFRRYFRVTKGGAAAMLMHAPPPHEDPRPFIAVARWLAEHGLRAPAILSAEPAAGWVLLEDFGNSRFREHVDAHPDNERPLYEGAVDALVALHRLGPGPFPVYDLAEYSREAGLFTEWFCPDRGLAVDARDWRAAWDVVLAPVLTRQAPGVVVLKDYHAENIMLPPDGTQGLIDFQDALVGHPAYDLVSLLQDARRDVLPILERAMLDRYIAAAAPGPEFEADYAVLGAQRNAKIVGVFTRLARRDGKPRYLGLIPRVWALLERDLAHPALRPVAAWFADNIPASVRANLGSTAA